MVSTSEGNAGQRPIENPPSAGHNLNLDAVMEQHDKAAASSTGEQPWLPMIGGAFLVGYGLAKPSIGGILTAALGGGLLYYGVTGRMPGIGGEVPDGDRSIRVEKSITINRPIGEVYERWRNIEDLPRIMSHLESVTDLGSGRSHWIAKAPLGFSVEWDAEILHDHENRVISWRSIEDTTTVPNVGAVHFHEAPGGGTELRVRIEYSPPAGPVGATFARLFGQEPGQQVEEDLRRFKQLLETGDVPSTDGQSRGVIDGVVERAKQAVDAVTPS
jgi:uncharacterized membrane protein